MISFLPSRHSWWGGWGAAGSLIWRLLLKGMDAPSWSGRHYSVDGPSDRAGLLGINLLSFLTWGNRSAQQDINCQPLSWGPGPSAWDSRPPAITTGSGSTNRPLPLGTPPTRALLGPGSREKPDALPFSSLTSSRDHLAQDPDKTFAQMARTPGFHAQGTVRGEHTAVAPTWP